LAATFFGGDFLAGILLSLFGSQHIANARLTEQIFDGGFCACFCTKDDSGNLSDAAVC